MVQCSPLVPYAAVHLVIDPEADELSEEGAREPGLDQEGVAHATLVQTLSHHLPGKVEVLEFQGGRAVAGVVGMHLQRV